jgi:hypothetical protein
MVKTLARTARECHSSTGVQWFWPSNGKGHGPCAPGGQGAPSNSAQETRGTRNNPILLLFIREILHIGIDIYIYGYRPGYYEYGRPPVPCMGTAILIF